MDQKITDQMQKQIEQASRPIVLTYSNYSRSSTGFGRQMEAILPRLRGDYNVIEFALGANPMQQMEEYHHGNIIIPNVGENGAYFNNELFGQSTVAAFLADTEKNGRRVEVAFVNHDPQALALIAPHLKKAKVPIVYWCLHDNDYISRQNLVWLSAADRIIFQTEYARRIVRSRTRLYDGPVIYPAIDQTQFPDEDPTVVLRKFDEGLSRDYGDSLIGGHVSFLDLIKGRRVVMVNGKNQARKNLAAILDAAKIVHEQFPDVLFFLHCPDTIDLDGSNKRLHPETLDVDDYLSAIDMPPGVVAVNRKQVPVAVVNAIYRVSTLMVNPSCSEGFGMTYLEAFQTGLPVIAVDYSATSEVLGEGRGVLVPPKMIIHNPLKVADWAYVDPNHLAEVINACLLSGNQEVKELLSKAKDAGKAWLTKYNSSAQADKISKELRTIIDAGESYRNALPVQAML